MKLFTKFFGTFAIIFSVLLMFQNCGGPMGGNAQLSSEELANLSIRDQSVALRKQYCLDCHNPSTGIADPRDILDDTALLNEGWIVPGKPEESHLYNSLFNGMPKGRPQLSDNEIQIFASWIKAMGESDLVPSNIQISDGPIYDFGSVATGEVASKSFTLKNIGEQEAQGLAGTLPLPFRFKGGAFPGEGGDCSGKLAANETCTIVVEFTPASADDFDKSLSIAYQDLEASKTASISLRGKGTGVARALLVMSNSPSYVFTSPEVGKNVSQTFNITNSGAATATSMAVSLGSGDFAITGQTCSTSLAVTKKCTVTVRFAPTNTNKQTTSLRISYSDGTDTTQTSISLVGTGIPVNTLYYSQIKSILSASCLSCHTSDFGTYTNLMAFKKSGSTPAITPSNANSRFITRISQGPNQMGKGSNGSLSAADQQKIISWIMAGAPNDPVVSPAVLSLSPSSTLDFGTVTTGTPLVKSLTLSHGGGSKAENIAVATLPSGFAFAGGTFPGAGGTCTATLTTGQSCLLKVEFKPVNATTYSGNLKLNYYNGKANTSVSVGLKGIGQGLPLAVLEFKDITALDFGLTKVKGTVKKTLTLKNSGSADAKAIAATALSSGFAFTGGKFPGTGGTCQTTLAKAASCTLSITFTGAKEGKFKHTLSLNYNNGSKALTITLPMNSQVMSDEPITYETIKGSLKTCFQCHATFRTYAGLMAVVKAKDSNSVLLQHIFGKNGRTQMGVGAYGSLTVAERQMIEQWVLQGALEYEKGSITQNFRPLVGDRYYITSVLHRVFGQDEKYVLPYTRTITSRMDLFGSPCFIQDHLVTDVSTGAMAHSYLPQDGCRSVGIIESRLNAEMVPAATTVSEATRQTACFRLANYTQNISSALALAKMKPTDAFDKANITKMYARFLPGTSPSQEEVDALIALGEEAVNNKSVKAYADSTKVLEGWRYVVMSLCLSPKWVAP